MLAFMRRRLLSSILVLIIFTYTYLVYVISKLNNEKMVNSLRKALLPDDISCYYANTPANVSDMASENSFSAEDIYFHDTTCSDNFKLSHVCAIEAAARTNLGRRIRVLLNRPIKECSCQYGLLGDLLEKPNIDISRINVEMYAIGTPLEHNFRSVIHVGKRRHKRVAEMLKFITLYRFGGTVLDLDVILATPVSKIGNNWAFLKGHKLGTSAMKVEKNKLGRRMVGRILRSLKLQYRDEVLDGSTALTAAYEHLCSHSNSTEYCHGFIAFNPNTILKINQTTKMVFNMREIIAYHFVERGYNPRDIIKNTMFDFVAQEYCPDVYNHFLRDLADKEYEE